jgi:hypothetical protein
LRGGPRHAVWRSGQCVHQGDRGAAGGGSESGTGRAEPRSPHGTPTAWGCEGDTHEGRPNARRSPLLVPGAGSVTVRLSCGEGPASSARTWLPDAQEGHWAHQTAPGARCPGSVGRSRARGADQSRERPREYDPGTRYCHRTAERADGLLHRPGCQDPLAGPAAEGHLLDAAGPRSGPHSIPQPCLMAPLRDRKRAQVTTGTPAGAPARLGRSDRTGRGASTS